MKIVLIIKVSLNLCNIYAYIIIIPKRTQYIIKPFTKNDVYKICINQNNKLYIYIYNIVIYMLYQLLQLSLISIMNDITK